ncbi:conserved protein, unknown function [Plasmodium vinckei vinckei]|uniref:Deubiquitinating enzyme MINDY-3/4 conserved domain-containing protein n=1 Tax=Plasmodium vinckei vinckei TaxID=54757 RepID=A0A449BVB2_PLAVN|nr:conserved protein, unknown function [Plasmodium vinckei vinckei]KEG02584.1 hypothetical protein YYE_02413 [Plasmodium vinckei vinckei]VEV57420.1 conserved protein, unknown function [Plasmodium vinckei vinckei]
MQTNEELLRKEEEEISKTIALSLEEYHASQQRNKQANLDIDDENDEMLQEAIRLSILKCDTKNTEKEKSDLNDSNYDIARKNFDKITYYLCNNYETTKNQTDIIDNKLFWKEIYKDYKNVYVIIKDYINNLNKRNEKLNERKKSSRYSSSNDEYDSDDNSSDCSSSSSLSCQSLDQIKKTYKNINYTTQDYCKWLKKGNRSKSLNDHVYVNYLLTEMKQFEDPTNLHNIVFGTNNYKYSNKMDIQKWCNHNISFYDDKNINFGLRQFLSGPCGLISSIQAYIIIVLLFNYKYNFLWENDYFDVLKTNNDFMNMSFNNTDQNKTDGETQVSSTNLCKEDLSKDSKNGEKKENMQHGSHHDYTKNDNTNDIHKNIDTKQVNELKNITSSHNKEVYSEKNDEEMNKKDNEILYLVREHIRDLKYYALVESLAYILYQCTDKSYYIIAFLLPECYDSAYFLSKQNSSEPVVRDLKKINIYYKEFSSIKDVLRFYLEHFIIFSSSTGAISFLYSVILTRGINNIKDDMDDINHPLIGIYGHCSQELVNLLLTGRACSNVFDNNSIINTFLNTDVDIVSMYENGGSSSCNNSSFVGINNGNDSKNSQNMDIQNSSSFNKNNIILKGINKRPLIGLLTDFEAFKYCEVGNFYKYPIYPIWVISSSNHYTVLFSLNIKNSRCTSEELYLEKLNKVWKKYDKEDNKYILSHFISRFIEDLNIKDEYRNMFRGFVNDLDILLYSEFKSFYLQVKQKDIDERKFADPPKDKYFYLYDAQEIPEKAITYFFLKEVDYDVSHDNNLKFFNTRWPNNSVEVLNKTRKLSR